MTDPLPNDDAPPRRCTPSPVSLDDVLARLAGCPRENWVDELHQDQASRWSAGEQVQVEHYLEACPEVAGNDEDALVLICGEMQLRRGVGQGVGLDEYQHRFPRFAVQLGLQFQLDSLLTAREANRPEAAICPSCQDSIKLPDNERPDQLICPSCGTSLRFDWQSTAQWSPTEIQRRLARYELIDLIGSGSFGTVYKARDPELDRIVAIKIPRAGSGGTKVDIERFFREARSIARLRHRSIVSIYEVGESAGIPYLVSEFVEGITLADLLSAKRPPPREAAELIASVADALHYAHEMGVVHRDVKPANIMLDQEAQPKLMDFGLAKRETGDVTMTMDGQILGTPAYMSPEQAKGEAHGVDGRTDVYSLGVILYQLLTGELPFRGTTRMLLHQVLHDEPRRPRSLADHVPRDLETVCLRAMGKEPSGRYATAREMADDLRRFLKGEPIHARPIGRAERLWRWSRRNPALATLGATVATLLVVVATGSAISAAQFRARAQTELQLRKTEQRLRNDAEEELYFRNIGLAHRELTGRIPNPQRAEDLLAACPERHREWEWDYLNRIWWDEQVVLRDPGNAELSGVAFNPDGDLIAAGCRDNSIKVWDLKTGDVVLTLPGHENRVVSVAFNPKHASRLASASADKTVRVWDLSTGKELLRCTGYESALRGASYSVTFSPDGQWLAAASEGGTVRVWDASTGRPIHELSGHENRASFVTFSRDGRQLATGSWTGTVRIWDAQTGGLLHKLPGDHIHPAGCASFSPDGRRLAVGSFDRVIDVWDTSSGKPLDRLTGHTGLVLGLAFSPDGKRLASASEDRTVRIWDPASGREILQLRGHTDYCQGLAFSPDGLRVATAGREGTIRLWDATAVEQERSQAARTFREHTREVWALDISRDGSRIAAAGLDAKVHLWDAETGRLVRTIPEITGVVFDMEFSPDDRHLAAVGIDDGKPPFVLAVWDAQTGDPLFPPVRRPREVFAVAFSPGDGQWLAIGLGDGKVELVDARTGQSIGPGTDATNGHAIEIHQRGLAFRSDGRRLVSLDNGGTVIEWEVTPEEATGKLRRVRTLRSASDPIFSVAFSPDGGRLVTGGKDGELTLWDADSDEPLRTTPGPFAGEIWRVAFSPNGQWIASAGASCTVDIWKASTLELIHSFRGHLGPIRSLAVSQDGRLLATCSADKTVKLWELTGIDGLTP